MGRKTGTLLLTAVALAGLGGCDDEGEETVATEPQVSCAGRADETLAAFDETLRDSDVELLREAWRPNHFKWFSLTRARQGGGRRHFVAYQPAAAIRYVKRNGGRSQLDG